MSRMEEELKQALRREDPGPDFADRVLARIAALPAAAAPEAAPETVPQKADWWQKLLLFFQSFGQSFGQSLSLTPQLKLAMAGALACAVLVSAVGIQRYRAHERALAEAAEGQKAKEQVMLAMRIASAKLNVAQKKVRETSDRQPGDNASER
ncbi:MAG: hypothetical protein JNJ50_26525 [Acidobacteria bacterium]|nr:hypothetical protein [Acidobacteriota bacterium]